MQRINHLERVFEVVFLLIEIDRLCHDESLDDDVVILHPLIVLLLGEALIIAFVRKFACMKAYM